jgi:LmbE family N-acetylglucosaminyl deacetylase
LRKGEALWSDRSHDTPDGFALPDWRKFFLAETGERLDAGTVRHLFRSLISRKSLNFSQSEAQVFVPDGAPLERALARVTHLGIGAHQDDLEFMAFHGIIACYRNEKAWFGGVTCTNGAGSARAGSFADYDETALKRRRSEEQNQAAGIGEYSAMLQLAHPSDRVKDPGDASLVEDLHAILGACRPRIVYTHNPADKHDTHVSVSIATIEAIRMLPAEKRPERVYGCEVWRDLDWLPDREKVVLDVSGFDILSARLNGVFHSQIAGGKRYDLGVLGRRRANATFLESHSVDRSDSVTYAMDLTPLIADASLEIREYVDGFIGRFSENVSERIRRLTPEK